MKKRLFFVFGILLIALFGCSAPSGTGSGTGNSLSGNPTKILISGAKSLFLQSGGAKAKATTGGADTLLMKINIDNTPEVAEFVDADGQPITVTINRTLQLSSEYLLVDFIYAEDNIVATVTLANGNLNPVDPAPGAWDWIRVKSGKMYYVAGGGVYRYDLASGSAAVMNAGVGAQHVNDSIIVLNPNDCIFVFSCVDGNIAPNTNNKFFVYYQDGSTPTDITGSINALKFALLYKENYTNQFMSEDPSTQDIYYLRFEFDGIRYQRMQFYDNGYIYVDAEKVLGEWSGGANRLASESGYSHMQNSVFGYDQQLAKLNASGGNIVADTYTASQGYFNDAVYRGGDVYYADNIQATKGVRRYQLGATLTETQIITDEITDFEPVGGDVFYCGADNKTYRYNLGTGLTELYADTPIDIRAVTE